MRAAILTATRRIEIQEIPIPRPGPGEVLIRVQVAGICGSELHAFNGTHPFRKPPAQQGHEMAGEVVEIGSQVSNLSVGDRVTVNPARTCGQCPSCLEGFPNLCDNKVMLGTPGWPGCFAEYITAPEKNVYKLPPHVSFEEGAIVEPLSVGVRAVRLAELAIGKSVAVLGAGTIGLACLAAAREAGASPIFATDVVEFNLNAARKFGADMALNPRTEDVIGTIRQATGGRGVDVAIVTAGFSPVVNQALAAVKKRGQVIAVALFEGPVTLEDTFLLVGGERVLKGSQVYTPQEFQIALNLIATGRVNAASFITHRLPLEEVQHGLEMLDEKREGCIKIMLKIA